MDGATYAAVSRNLAMDSGTWWDLFYTPNLYPHFIEHPPLHIWLQSFVFHFLGDQWWIEDVFGLTMWLLTAWGLDRLGEKLGLSTSQLLAALFMWTLIPVVNWGYSNNLLEISMSAWLVWSVYFSVQGIRSQRFFPLVIAGTLVSAGALTKGPVALFPLAVPFFWFLLYPPQPSWKWARPTAVLFLGFVLPFFVLYWLRDAQDYFIRYWNKQIIQSLENVQTVSNRWYLLGQFALQLAIPGGIVLWSHFQKRSTELKFPKVNRTAWVLWAISLSAVLPMLISMKQRDFYLIPAMGFAALALAFHFRDSRFVRLLAIRQSYMRALFLFLGLGFGLRFIPAITDTEQGALVASIQALPQSQKGQTIYVAPELLSNWNIIAQCARFGPIYFKPKPLNQEPIGHELKYVGGIVVIDETSN